ncbi:hypothetical protein SBI_02808 [Streptomyces bingchenggensis BCW-1]|uniref:Uncharacterized protein n=1 Tax=Streptomyces bingchenggensis (strain BCW-1) TaxID=749414 RepID=D7C2P6_STRBB|nr:hypothetical protein SBI_02808 [Streptomyces bingchenggensis BCW-1]
MSCRATARVETRWAVGPGIASCATYCAVAGTVTAASAAMAVSTAWDQRPADSARVCTPRTVSRTTGR